MINCIGWRGDLQKPPGLYKGGHLLMHGDYILTNIIVGLLDIGLKYRYAQWRKFTFSGGGQSLLNFRQNFQIPDIPPICTRNDCF
jgi:hypothetical protein